MKVSLLQHLRQFVSATYTFALRGMTKKPIRLINLIKAWKGLPHQNAALNELEDLILRADPDAFNKDQDWYCTWSASVYDKRQDYKNHWDGIYAAAKQAGAKYPECVAAQWALESGWGKHVSGVNNFFGLKGSGTSLETKEFLDGQWVTVTSSFIDFPSVYSCVEYLVKHWYRDYRSYSGVNRARSREECARLLVREGYATDPAYSKKLINIMKAQSRRQVQRILEVPYEYQLDNFSGEGYRECFSSTCAMIANFYGEIDSDDEYNVVRSQYGDTADVSAQVAALRSLGFDARFSTRCNAEFLESEINSGRPVAVGWLHRGSIHSPTGGGHWSCCIGYTEDDFVFNDPNGKADMEKGGYITTDSQHGYKVRYNKKQWLRRWEVDGSSTGWAIVVRPEF